MRLDRRRENLWRSTCCKSTRLLQLFAMPTQTRSRTKARTWHRTDSIMAWHLACEMPWSSQWQSCLRGSKPAPVLTHCTHWPRRWRHVSLQIHKGGARVFGCLSGQVQEITYSHRTCCNTSKGRVSST